LTHAVRALESGAGDRAAGPGLTIQIVAKHASAGGAGVAVLSLCESSHGVETRRGRWS
jgi:hypothetical protein